MIAKAKDEKPLIIVYHAECVDGAACAWSVAKAHGVDKEPEKQKNVTYIPYAHHDVATAEEKIRAALTPDATLYFVDVAPTKPFLDELMTPAENGVAKVKQLNIMDHHDSQTRDLKGYAPPVCRQGGQPGLNVLIDPNRHSAATMVWTELLGDEPPPPVLDVIDKMDGDASGLVTPKDFAAAAAIDEEDISSPAKAFNTLRGLAKHTFNEIVLAGGHLAEEQASEIDRRFRNMVVMNMQILPGMPPVPVAVVHAQVSKFGRQISSRLIDAGKEAGSGVAFAWFLQKNGTVTMSIRTDGDPDAADIAAYFRKTMAVTGGGHSTASAVHFSSLMEFGRRMHMGKEGRMNPAPGVITIDKPPSAKKPPEAFRPPSN